METTTTTTTSTTTQTPDGGRRNTFLTVLCILTFIGSGWGIIKQVRSYINADLISNVASDAIKEASDKVDTQTEPSFVKNIFNSITEKMNPDTIRKGAIAGLIADLLTLLGGILMFNQKKIGFYIYILGTVILIFAPMLLGKFVGLIGGFFIGIVGIAFIIMYGVNLNNMNK